MLDTKTLAHGDIETAFHEAGEGTPLLLLHGFTGSKLDFHDEIARLASAHRVIVPDNRGHGESTKAGEYSVSTLVADLESFVEAMGLKDLHLLGHSLGGMVAMRYALRRPERLGSLILMDTSPAPMNMPAKLRESFARSLETMGVQGMIEMMKARPAPQQIQNGIDALGADEHWRRIEQKLTQMDPAAFHALGMELSGIADVISQLTQLRLPTTVIVGEADDPFIEPSRMMAKAIPNAVLEIIEDAAHSPQYENRDAWRRAIDSHLGRVSRGGHQKPNVS